MKIIFYVLVFFQFFVLNAQDKTNQLDENGLRHGLWKGIHEQSKRPRYEGTFEHGKEIGVFKYYDDTKAGTVIATRDFSKGDGSCYTTFFDQKGNKVSEGLVVNKEFEGEWKYYHQESKDLMSVEFYKKGKLNGVRKVFYKSKKIAEETNYVDGLKNGSSKIYAENGNILESVNYKNDKLEGSAKYYNSNGVLMYEGIYKNGAKAGTWSIYEKGKVIKTCKGEKFAKELAKLNEQKNKAHKVAVPKNTPPKNPTN